MKKVKTKTQNYDVTHTLMSQLKLFCKVFFSRLLPEKFFTWNAIH